jgi:hypothetical protein
MDGYDDGWDGDSYSWSSSSWSGSSTAGAIIIVIITLLCVMLVSFILILIILICFLRKSAASKSRLGIVEMRIPNQVMQAAGPYNPYIPVPQDYPQQPGPVPATIFSVNPALSSPTNAPLFISPVSGVTPEQRMI